MVLRGCFSVILVGSHRFSVVLSVVLSGSLWLSMGSLWFLYVFVGSQ